MNAEKRTMTLVAKLPDPGPWEMTAFRGIVVLTSPSHPPMVHQNGVLGPLDLGSEPGSALPKWELIARYKGDNEPF